MAAKGNSKIMRFRQDRRLMVVGALQSFALITALATVVFCIYNYYDDLNIANAKRIYAYLTSASSGDEVFTGYRFERGISTVYKPFAAGLAVVSGDIFKYATTLGGDSFSIQLKYSDPVISAGEKNVLLYDRGGKGFTISSTYAELMSTTLESPIISGEMNPAGHFTIVTDEVGYRSAVTLYSKRQKQLYKWQTSTYYTMLASPTHSGDGFAALCLSENGGEVSMSIKGFDVSSDDVIYDIDLGTRSVYSMKHYKNGDLVIICDDGVYIYNQGEMQSSYHYPLGSLKYFVHNSAQAPLLVISPDGGGLKMVALSADCTEKYVQSFSTDLRAVDCYDNMAALLFSNGLTVVDFLGDRPQLYELESGGARDVLVRYDRKPILVYTDRAEPIDLTTEEVENDTTNNN